ncbi:PDZ domain-containing protein [Xylanibacillus composti]|uniref:Peptidase S1 n=1 Tax=Xylanibacillus composti TaxID=1572762 RepID=A0A8J4H884_9BACL|nr:trypsin-like peptidase domain-containing protein [Xylanibacillus composti]MDT9724717.1 PDZ domain-containing protein [Xylanibacillus composti]GIQ70718.1 peptidase S1 [Xylanibacillus composti]
MDEKDKQNRDYSDFFSEKREQPEVNRSHMETNQPSEEPVSEAEVETWRPERREYHYYSYSSKHDANDLQEISPPLTKLEELPSSQVAVEVPPAEQANPAGPKSNWSAAPRKKSGFRRAFLAFLAGAVVMGGLMFGADHYNLFTGGANGGASGAAPVSGSGTLAANSGEGGSGVRTANLDVVRPSDISGIVDQASPAVVKIETFVKGRSASSGSSLFNDPFFRQFFGDDFFFSRPEASPRNADELQPAGMGTGFIFDKEGYILTNQHVIGDADVIRVYIQDYNNNEPVQAELLGSSYDLDLAVLKIEGSGEFPTLPLGNADQTKVGDWVVAIGNPYGFDHTVTVGVLSAKERPITVPDSQGTRQYEHLLQTDASINPGNSGGPLLNLNGEVIGINTAVNSQAQGIGFAIPTSTITQVLDNLKNNESIPKPYIGIYMADLQEGWLRELKVDSTDGVVIQSIIEGSPAEMAGLRPYDVILQIDGKTIKNTEELSKTIQAKAIGDKIEMTVSRDGTKATTVVTIGDQNAS